MTLTQNCYAYRTWAACAATVLCLSSTVTQANPSDVSATQQVVVRFGDLNLSAPQGAEALYGRIHTAARQVCGPEETKDLAQVSSRRACIEKSVADAVAHVGNAQLRAVYEAHQGHGQATRIAAVAQR